MKTLWVIRASRDDAPDSFFHRFANYRAFLTAADHAMTFDTVQETEPFVRTLLMLGYSAKAEILKR